MATRVQTSARRNALIDKLRSGCRSGRLRPGDPAPPLRQLAEEFGISKNVVNQALQSLVDEGLFHTVPRVGTFVGQPTSRSRDLYLLLLPDNIGLIRQINLQLTQQGFEERITELGSASLVMKLSEAVALRQSGNLPPVAGLYDLAYHHDDAIKWGIDRTRARVAFSGRVEDAEHSDVVSYDDRDGGRQATRHLLRLGHRQIAFLALHGSGDRADNSEMVWSREREEGWEEAMAEAGLSCEALSFHPEVSINRFDLMPEIIAPSRALWRRSDITAVVAANDLAAVEMLKVPGHAARGESRIWPAVIGFDNLPDTAGFSLSSLRLPAEKIGRAAADLLFERHHGKLQGPPRHRRVSMHLISRLTSSREWTESSALRESGPARTPVEVP